MKNIWVAIWFRLHDIELHPIYNIQFYNEVFLVSADSTCWTSMIHTVFAAEYPALMVGYTTVLNIITNLVSVRVINNDSN